MVYLTNYFLSKSIYVNNVELWTCDLIFMTAINGHRRPVYGCDFAPKEKLLVTCSGDKTVKVWSLEDYTCVRVTF